MRIAITNHGSRFNKGTAALLNSRISAITKEIPDVEFIVFTYHPEISYLPELKYVNNKNIKFYRIPIQFGVFPRLENLTILKLVLANLPVINKRLKMFAFKEILASNVIISTGGDVLTEDYGIISFLNHASNLLLGILLKKPVIIYAESIGPFNCWLARKIAKFLLVRSEFVALRENMSKKYVESLGISPNKILLTMDSAFFFKPFL